MMRPLIQTCFIAAVFMWPLAVSAKVLNVAFVYTGSPSVPGWTAQHDKARQQVEAYFGPQVAVKTVENLKPGADAERVIIGLARDGAELIFITDPLLIPQATEAAQRFPQAFFEFVRGKSEFENVASYNGRFYQAYYIFGQIAASITQHGKIGFTADMRDPASTRAANAYALGAQSVDKATEIVISYAGDINDPVKQAAAARRVIDGGVDVLAYQANTPAPVQIAEQNGVWSFGSGADMSTFAPQRQVTSVNYEWGGYYIKRVQAALQGGWKPGNVWAGFDEGIVSIGDIRFVDAKTRDKAIDTRQRLIDGTFDVFAGPLIDQAGAEKLKKDEKLTDEQLRVMDWFVAGNLKILQNQQDAKD